MFKTTPHKIVKIGAITLKIWAVELSSEDYTVASLVS